MPDNTPNHPDRSQPPSVSSASGLCRVEVDTETECEHGWSYGATIQHQNGTKTSHTVTLAWCDHDHWSGGRTAPSKVIQAVLEYAVAHLRASSSSLPAKFDAARIRRLCPLLDAELRLPG